MMSRAGISKYGIAEVMERHGGRYDIRPAEGSPEGARSIQ